MIRLKTSANKDICCFLASDEFSRANGLNGWGKLPPGAGLLFEFAEPEYVVFHMDRVWYPIDIIMLDASATVVNIYKNCQPGTIEKYPAYDIKWVLELSAGECDRLGLGIGSVLRAHKGSYAFDNLVKPQLLSIHAAYNGFMETGIGYGACISHGSTPVGWGWNKVAVTENPTHHAEIIAISDALARGSVLKGAGIFASHQPCMMCAGASAWSEFSTINYLIPAENNTTTDITTTLGTSPQKISVFVS